MKINQIIELSMLLDHERFQKVFKHGYSEKGYMGDNEDEYIDRSLEEKGIIVLYRDSKYKKRIKVTVNIERLLNGNELDLGRIVQKIDKRIRKYFDFKYTIEDFFLSGMRFITDINVWNQENVRAYLKVFQRIGKVKGFSKTSYECLEDVDSFCLSGNSNNVEFMIYSLEELYKKDTREYGVNWKKVKDKIKDLKGILRAEVWLTKPKAIRAYTDTEDVCLQIKECHSANYLAAVSLVYLELLSGSNSVTARLQGGDCAK